LIKVVTVSIISQIIIETNIDVTVFLNN